MTNGGSPSLGFTQLCNYLAVHSTLRDEEETVRNLVLQTMVVLLDEPFQTSSQIAEAIEVLFGIRFTETRIQVAVDQLTGERVISRTPSGCLAVTPTSVTLVKQRIDEANALQSRVKERWTAACLGSQPKIDSESAWCALQEYLARTFRQHGMQTMSLLDSSFHMENGPQGLRSVLAQVVAEKCCPEQAQAVENCVANFLAEIGQDEDRARFVVQLADGAFSFFAANAPPEIARTLQKNLSALTLFLDTNFLFGVLDLHVNPLVEASQELIEIINSNDLPFSLRFHPMTEREMTRTVDAIAVRMSGKAWPQALSRAAIQSKNITGLELKFHESNARTPIDPSLFFAPYRHIDVLLRDKHILPLDGAQQDSSHSENEWLSEYQQYIRARRPEKPRFSIDHDATLLDAVHRRRTMIGSSLEAGALCITCDYLLYRFDWEESARRGVQPVMVLPNLLLQLLRPFLPPSWDFDRMFAETFAIPEFRTMESRSGQAASQLLAILATYRDFPEATAIRMLANDTLLDELRNTHDAARFQEQVEAAIVAENSELLEDKVALERQLADDRVASEEERQRLIAETRKLAARHEEDLRTAQAANQARLDLQEELQNTAGRADSATVEAERLRKFIRRSLLGLRIAGFVAFGSAWVAGVLLIPDWAGWQWLLDHPNRYGIQAVASLLGVLASGGAFLAAWRNRLWYGSAGALALIVVLLSLLGGPKP